MPHICSIVKSAAARNDVIRIGQRKHESNDIRRLANHNPYIDVNRSLFAPRSGDGDSSEYCQCTKELCQC